MKIRYVMLWAVLGLILVVTNSLIFRTEKLLANGHQVFLELGTRDPRSLLQGDYMTLTYEIAQGLPESLPATGYLVIRIDKDRVAQFVRVHTDTQALSEGELLLRYHRQDWNVYLGAESFFFQEGQADAYDSARYAELRLDDSGNSVLVGLRDEKLKPLGQPTSDTLPPVQR